MDTLFFVGFAVAAAFVAAILKRMEPAIAAFVSLGACIMLLLGTSDWIKSITASMQSLTQSALLDSAYIQVLLRIVGIAYIAQIGAQACRDAGSANIADHVELCARLAILSIAAPLFVSLMDLITEVLR